MQPSRDYAKRYNRLQDVLKAHDELVALSKGDVLDDLAGVILRHDFQDIFGIRLLHRHNDVYDGEIMAETDEYLNSKPCLTTIAINCQDIAPDVFTNTWQFQNGAMLPLEYSKDRSVRNENLSLKKRSSFFQKFGEVLEKRRVVDLLGPCVVSREFHKTKPNDSAILVEVTDSRRRANMVMFSSPDEYDRDKLIDATWIVKSPWATRMAVGCGTYCASGGACVPFSVCTVDTDGNHVEQSTHSTGSHIAQHVQTGDA